MNKIISSVFFHEIKNSLNSIRFGVEIFDKYEMTEEEKKNSINDVLTTVDNTVEILEEYMQFVKFKFTQKLKYKNVNIHALLVEIQKELAPFANKKGINIYIQKQDITLYTNEFWLKRAIYNIVYNAIKYNKEYGAISIKLEDSTFGTYLSISDTGIGISNKKLKSVFKIFETIDETRQGVGIGLALSKAVLESIGGDLHVQSSENIGTEFVMYIPHRPKSVTIKRMMLSMVPASLILFLGISYFPIYSQKVIKHENGGYIVYTLEDGSVMKFSKNSKYEFKAYKNLYNTKYVISSTIKKGSVSLKAIKNKAAIYVDDREFNNLGTDFEIIKDKNTRLAVFDGEVQSDALVVDKGQGGVIDKNIKIIKLLPPVEDVTIKKSELSFRASPKSLKYQILISTNKEFNKIDTSFFTTKTNLHLQLSKDTLYYIKIFEYDKYGLPSLPKIVKYVNLSHYYKAMELLKTNKYEAMLELESSVSTIGEYSSLPYFALAKVLYHKKDYLESLKLVKKAISINAQREYYYLMFDLYTKLNEPKEIEKQLNIVLNKYPTDIKFLYYKAKMLFQNGIYKQANQVLFKILQQKPNYKDANLLMAQVLKKMGNITSAKYYERLVK